MSTYSNDVSRAVRQKKTEEKEHEEKLMQRLNEVKATARILQRSQKNFSEMLAISKAVKNGDAVTFDNYVLLLNYDWGTQNKRTPWCDDKKTTPPRANEVYEIKTDISLGICFSYWNGKHWCLPASSPDAALLYRRLTSYIEKAFPWRELEDTKKLFDYKYVS